MKKILLLKFDAKTAGDLQAQYASECEFFAMDDFDIALKLIKKEAVETLFIKAPPEGDLNSALELKMFLKKLNKRRFKRLQKILVAEKGGDARIEDILNLGISAVVLDVGEVGRWV